MSRGYKDTLKEIQTMGLHNTTFDNFFNLTNDDLSRLEIKENFKKDNCLIQDKSDHHKFYNTFIIQENSQSKVICEISFYPSSVTSKYLPRLTFKKIDHDGNIKEAGPKKPIIIAFRESEQALIFWKLIGFLNSFKDIVDLGEFEKSFSVYSKAKFILEFETQDEQQKIEDLKLLVKNLKENDIKSIVFEKRKHTINVFLYLLKNENIKGKNYIEWYREKHNLKQGEETVWHHFLKKHDWILGLNVDIKFIRDFYDEQKTGQEDSKGRGSPKVDMLGISDYTTLIELKHSNTPIFKKTKTTNSKANTWDFTSDFIEGVSQCLGQKFSLDKNYDSKEFVNDDKIRLDKMKHLTLDPKTVFIIGNRKIEFPLNLVDDNYIKSNTFELFRRNNRNIDIITFDELFERAYHLVFSEKVPENWFTDNAFIIEE